MTTLLESAFNTFYDYNVDFQKINTREFVQNYRHHFDELAGQFGGVDFANIDTTEVKKIAQDIQDRAFAYGLDKAGDAAELLHRGCWGQHGCGRRPAWNGSRRDHSGGRVGARRGTR